MNDPSRQFSERTIKSISDDDQRKATGDDIALDHTRWALDITSERGLERTWQWLDSLTRQYPLNGILFQQHRVIIEGLKEDIEVEMARREGRNGS
jgi:hypothetical protein